MNGRVVGSPLAGATCGLGRIVAPAERGPEQLGGQRGPGNVCRLRSVEGTSADWQTLLCLVGQSKGDVARPAWVNAAYRPCLQQIGAYEVLLCLS